MPSLNIGQVFDIIRRAHETMDWRPNGNSSRDDRNRWFEAGVAAVHYGHDVLNPAGGDSRWCIKNAGGGRPQSDDIVVLKDTREYWDLIGATGTDGYSWSIGAHDDRLPSNQEVYPPARAALGLFASLQPGPAPTPPTPGPGPAPVPPPAPPPGVDLVVLVQNLWATLDAVKDAVISLEARTADIVARQGQIFEALAVHVSKERDFLHQRLVEERATIVEAISRVDAKTKCVLRR